MRLLQTLFLSSCCALITYAGTLSQTIELSEQNPSIQAATKKAKVYEQLSEVAKSAQYPSLDLSYGATYLYEEPVMYLQGSFPGFPPSTPPVQMQAQNLYIGTLKLTYPLFSGFAISASIDKANLRKYRALLDVENAKRNLYMNVVQAYTTALALQHLITSQEEAYQATQQSYKKAKAFFDLGMISQAELYRIDAGQNAIKAKLIQTKNSYDIALSQLSLMTQQKITDLAPLPKYQTFSLNSLTQKALENRPDIKALRTMLKEQESQIKLAKSSYYPTVGVFVQLVWI
ncbi:TolC family protein [Sulfurimonas sp.]|uniref:TolC family protein n=1 Tax=Sulfurimonas sp. TaxID=2022749 RepID=UPI00262BD86C|nr:TolC family protein [Sulfurimonas sp.]